MSCILRWKPGWPSWAPRQLQPERSSGPGLPDIWQHDCSQLSKLCKLFKMYNSIRLLYVLHTRTGKPPGLRIRISGNPGTCSEKSENPRRFHYFFLKKLGILSLRIRMDAHLRNAGTGTVSNEYGSSTFGRYIDWTFLLLSGMDFSLRNLIRSLVVPAQWGQSGGDKSHPGGAEAGQQGSHQPGTEVRFVSSNSLRVRQDSVAEPEP